MSDSTVPSAEVPPPPPPKSGAPGRFDLGRLLGFAFRDPRAVSKFVIGSIAVLCIPLFGLGLLALLGFKVRTARGALRGDEHPMPDWDDFGGLLLDGIKALGILLGYAAASAAVGFGFLALGVFWIAIGESMGSPPLVVLAVVGTVVAAFFLLLVILFAKVMLPAGLLRLAQSGRFGSAFRLGENVALVRAHPGAYIVLLLVLVLFAILADASVLLCLVGAIPGAFWGFAASGAAIGHAGRLMGLRDETGAA